MHIDCCNIQEWSHLTHGNLRDKSGFTLFMGRTILKSLIVAFLGFIFEVGLDVLLRREGSSRIDLLLISNGLTAMAFGLLAYFQSRQSMHLRELNETRMAVVREVNHHVRNALQVISFHASYSNGSADGQTMGPYRDMIQDAIARIDWALKDVLSVGKPPEGNTLWPSANLEVSKFQRR